MWKPIAGYYRKYMVSTDGQVKSMARIKSNNQPIPETILKQSSDSAGYKYVSLYDEKAKKNKRYRVHRLVASAFIRNDDFANKKTVNHKNGIKSDNRVENLEWCTFGENKSHSFKHLGEIHWAKGKKGKDSPYSKKVEQINIYDGSIVNTFDSTRQVHEKLGFSQGNISAVCRGIRKIANGFYWRYANEQSK